MRLLVLGQQLLLRLEKKTIRSWWCFPTATANRQKRDDNNPPEKDMFTTQRFEDE
jgi:hypothetical protein